MILKITMIYISHLGTCIAYTLCFYMQEKSSHLEKVEIYSYSIDSC